MRPVNAFSKGALVQTLWDAGGGRDGVTTMYGEVVSAGPKTFTVEWESGCRNRLEHGRQGIAPARHEDEARRSIDRCRAIRAGSSPTAKALAALLKPDVSPSETGSEGVD